MTDEQSNSYLALLALLSLVVFLRAWMWRANADSGTATATRLAGSVPPPAVMESAASSRGEEVGENDVVRVDTQVITVPVVVRDQQGRRVTGLTASAFQLYEEKECRCSNKCSEWLRFLLTRKSVKKYPLEFAAGFGQL